MTDETILTLAAIVSAAALIGCLAVAFLPDLEWRIAERRRRRRTLARKGWL